MHAPTFADLLARELRRDGARPLVTFYDDASGERVELSVTTYANWVAKTASLLQDELDLGRGGRILVDLPVHWLTPVWLGAAWSVGAEVLEPADQAAPTAAADLVVSGPERLEEHTSSGAPVVGVSLRPMGARFAEAVPQGVVDYGAVVWGQPDAFAPLDPPLPEDPAWAGAEGGLRQRDLVALDADGHARVLTDLAPVSRRGVRALVGPLAAGGGTVWVAHASDEVADRLAAAERAERWH